VTTAQTILAWVGLALGVVVLGLVVGLFNRVVRPALEIRRYADEVADAVGGISRNLEGAGELARTRELADAVPGLATAYLARVRGPT
jgi:hypothetical protein